MLTTVIIILREFLEAALLISLLVVLHLKFHFYRNWIFTAIGFGIVGAFLYAHSLANISEWFNGSGQEIINGLSLLCIGLCLTFQITNLSVIHKRNSNSLNPKTKNPLMLLTISAVLIVVMAITREGAEIFVYFSGINTHPEKISSMIIGGIIGGGLGICIGVLVFVILYQLGIQNLVLVTSTLLILITAGIMSEATQSFIQAGLLMTDEPLWDSSHFISESSVVGQLLYAVFAYEATPTLEEIVVWIITTFTLSSILIWIYYKNQPSPTT